MVPTVLPIKDEVNPISVDFLIAIGMNYSNDNLGNERREIFIVDLHNQEV